MAVINWDKYSAHVGQFNVALTAQVRYELGQCGGDKYEAFKLLKKLCKDNPNAVLGYMDRGKYKSVVPVASMEFNMFVLQIKFPEDIDIDYRAFRYVDGLRSVIFVLDISEASQITSTEFIHGDKS